MRAVHVIKNIMSGCSMKRLKAYDFAEASAKVHRETGLFPANAIVIHPKARRRLVGAEALRPVEESRQATFAVTIPDAKCIGILEHRHYVFTSEHMPPTQALVFNTGFNAEGHMRRDDKIAYCIVESGEKGMFF